MPKNDKNSGPFDLSRLVLDRSQGLSEQIRQMISGAITRGHLQPGVRLPSCRDLAAQLGVARGTVRLAYDMLADSQLLVAKGAAGTFVTLQPPVLADSVEPPIPPSAPLPGIVSDYDSAPLIFQMGVPASDAFPAKVWSRILQRHARQMVSHPAAYPDPRGSLALRRELTAYLALTRGIRCHPDGIILTNGYAGALGLICLAMGFAGTRGWLEDPGYLLSRQTLALIGIETMPVPVDQEEINVQQGIAIAPDAAFALVTAGQQAPLGMTLSLARRRALLAWASEQQRWIIEDDYLGELQLDGRAAPALASLDSEGRVLHIGTFSKTLSPALRLGFLVVPPPLAGRFGELSAGLMPASSFLLQDAVAEFMRDGHYLRHLRRMKRIYRERLISMHQALSPHFSRLSHANLSVIIWLPEGAPDVAIASAAVAWGMAPQPLSSWYRDNERRRYGLQLGVTQLPRDGFERCAARLKWLVDGHCSSMGQ